MSSRKIPRAADHDSGALSKMQDGDVLVTHSSAVREHDISVVPDGAHATVPTRCEAIDQATEEARTLEVDAWVTEDQIHVVRIAGNRPVDG